MSESTLIRWDYPDHFPAPARGAKPVLWLLNDAWQQVGWLMPGADDLSGGYKGPRPPTAEEAQQMQDEAWAKTGKPLPHGD
jgi:hypothetical protein